MKIIAKITNFSRGPTGFQVRSGSGRFNRTRSPVLDPDPESGRTQKYPVRLIPSLHTDRYRNVTAQRNGCFVLWFSESVRKSGSKGLDLSLIHI